MQNALVCVKIGLTASVSILGAVAVFLPDTSTRENADNLSRLGGSKATMGTLSFFQLPFSRSPIPSRAMIMRENVPNEVKDPVRRLKTRAPAALLTVAFPSMLLNTAYPIVMPLDET